MHLQSAYACCSPRLALALSTQGERKDNASLFNVVVVVAVLVAALSLLPAASDELLVHATRQNAQKRNKSFCITKVFSTVLLQIRYHGGALLT